MNKRLHYPILIAAIGDYYKDTISKTKLLQIGKIQALTESMDSTKVLGFTMEVGENAVFVPYQSSSEFLTKEMIDHILLLPKGSAVIFDQIRCRIPNGKIKFLKSFSLNLTTQ